MLPHCGLAVCIARPSRASATASASTIGDGLTNTVVAWRGSATCVVAAKLAGEDDPEQIRALPLSRRDWPHAVDGRPIAQRRHQRGEAVAARPNISCVNPRAARSLDRNDRPSGHKTQARRQRMRASHVIGTGRPCRPPRWHEPACRCRRSAPSPLVGSFSETTPSRTPRCAAARARSGPPRPPPRRRAIPAAAAQADSCPSHP